MDKDFEGIVMSGGSRTSKSPGPSIASASKVKDESFEMKALVILKENRISFVSPTSNAKTMIPTLTLKAGGRLQISSSKEITDVHVITKSNKCMIFSSAIKNWKAISFRTGSITQYMNICFFDEETFRRLERTLSKLKLWEVTQGDQSKLLTAEKAICTSLNIPHPSVPEQRLQARPTARLSTNNEDITAIKDVQLGDSNRKLLMSKRATANISYRRTTEEYRLTLGINLPPFKVKSCEVICCPEFYSVEFACELGEVSFVQFKLQPKSSVISSKEFQNAFATPYGLAISFSKDIEPHKDYEIPERGEFKSLSFPISPAKTITVSSRESSNENASQPSVSAAYPSMTKTNSNVSQSHFSLARQQLNGGFTATSKSSIESFAIKKPKMSLIPAYEKTPQTTRPTSTVNLLPASSSSGKETMGSTRSKATITYGSSSSAASTKRSRPTIDLFDDPINDDDWKSLPVRRMTRSQAKSSDTPILVSSGFRTSKEIAAREKVLFRYPAGAVVDLVPIRRSDVDRLGDGIFLNDSLIDFYGKRHLEERVKQATVKNKVHLFSSFFFSRMDHKLSGQSRRRGNGAFDFTHFSDEAMQHRFEAYSRVRTWSRGVDIFEKRFLIVPINRSMHWSVAIVELIPTPRSPDPSEEIKEQEEDKNLPPQARVFTLDSLGSLHPPHHVTNVIRMYLNHEWMARKKAKSDGKPWPLPPRVVPIEEAEDERTSKAGSDDDDDDSEIEIVDAPSAVKKDGVDDQDRFVVTEADQVYTEENCEYIKLKVPPQRDAYNCGVYALKNIEEFLTIYDGKSAEEKEDFGKVLEAHFLNLDFYPRDAHEFRKCFRKDLEALAELALAAQKPKEHTSS